MKRKLVLTFALLLMLFPLSAQNLSYFTTSDTRQVHDYRTDINLEFIDSYYNFYSLNNISRTVTNVIKTDETHYFESYYDKGLIIKEISHVHERSVDELKYDNQNRLLKNGYNFTYKYTSEKSRERYFRDQIQFEEIIESEKNYFKVTRNNFTIRFSDNLTVPDGKDILEFFYNENENLIEYKEENWNRKGIKDEYVKKVDFEYDENQKLIKIISGYEGGDIRFITTIEYDEDGNMSELVRKNIRENTSETVRFSRYDFYGNWHNSMTYDNTGELKETVVREIFYN